MGKLVVASIVSLDGVMEKPIWANEYWTKELIKLRNEDLDNSDILLLGRKTFETYKLAYGGLYMDEYSRKINEIKKIVFSNTLSDQSWNSTFINKNDIETLKLMKKNNNILVVGSISVARFLFEEDLVDEFHHVLIPKIVGEGRKLFHGSFNKQKFETLSSKIYPNGVIYSVFTKI